MVTHPLQIVRRPGKVRLSETDVLTTELLHHDVILNLCTKSEVLIVSLNPYKFREGVPKYKRRSRDHDKAPLE